MMIEKLLTFWDVYDKFSVKSTNNNKGGHYVLQF